MPTAAFAGFCGQVSVSTDGNDYIVLGETRDSTLTLNQAEIDATSYNCAGWVENIPGLKSWEMSTESLFLVNQDVGQVAVFDAIIASQTIFWRFLPRQGAGRQGYYGQGFATSFEVNVPVDDAVSLSLSVIGTGALATYQVA